MTCPSITKLLSPKKSQWLVDLWWDKQDSSSHCILNNDFTLRTAFIREQIHPGILRARLCYLWLLKQSFHVL